MYIRVCNMWKSYFKYISSGNFLRSSTILLMDAAIQSIGILGKANGLPLPNEGGDELNKKAIVDTLFSVLNNVKLNTKVCFLSVIMR